MRYCEHRPKYCIVGCMLTYVCTIYIANESMKSTKVQNPRRILHILRSMPMRVHRACAGFGQKLYACALFIIDGLGHATWSLNMPVSRSGTAPFWRNRHIIFPALVALEPLLSLMSRFCACSARISGDRHTHTHTHTDTHTHRHTERLP